jgi:hypothetical protein
MVGESWLYLKRAFFGDTVHGMSLCTVKKVLFK